MFGIQDIYRSKSFAKTFAKYSTGLLVCLQAYNNPVFPRTKKIDTSHAIFMQDAVTDPIYSLEMTSADKAALQMPVDDAIVMIKSLIEKDANGPMAHSFLQSRRYLWLGNRYLSKALYASATQSYIQAINIFEKIQNNIPEQPAQEHNYKLFLQLAKVYTYQESSQDNFLHEKGISFAQQAQDIAEYLMESNPESTKYIDRYYGAMIRKAALYTNGSQYGTAGMLYNILADFYEKNQQYEDLALTYKNKAIIEYKQDQLQAALILMEQADWYFQKHFDQTNEVPNINYKTFLLQYAMYLVSSWDIDQAKFFFEKQDSIITSSEDVKAQTKKIALWTEFIQAQDPVGKAIILKSLDEYYTEQEGINSSNAISDATILYEAEKKAAQIREQQLLIKNKNTEIAVQKTQTKLALSEADRQKAEKEAAEQREKTEIANKEKAQAEAKEKAIQLESEEKQKKLSFVITWLLFLLLSWWAVLWKKLYKQRQELRKKNQQIEEQREDIYKANKTKEETIQAAATIQKDILPSLESLKKHFPESWMLFNPHSDVSGDFYRWGEKNNVFYWSVADSTGHGVHGAMTSIAWVKTLYASLENDHITQPDQILDYLDTNIWKHTQWTLKEWMDMAICAYDKANNKLTFAGAKNPVWILKTQEDAIQEIKWGRFAINGGRQEWDMWPLEEVSVHTGDLVIMFSDGVPDQFGWPLCKKFMKPKFRELLLDHRDKSPEEIVDILNTTLHRWMRTEKLPILQESIKTRITENIVTNQQQKVELAFDAIIEEFTNQEIALRHIYDTKELFHRIVKKYRENGSLPENFVEYQMSFNTVIADRFNQRWGQTDDITCIVVRIP